MFIWLDPAERTGCLTQPGVTGIDEQEPGYLGRSGTMLVNAGAVQGLFHFSRVALPWYSGAVWNMGDTG